MDNENESEIQKLFKKEYLTLTQVEKTEQYIADNSIDLETLKKEYELLAKTFKRLLNDAVKITRINDITQQQLCNSKDKLQEQKEILHKASITDRLTNIYNRAYLIDALSAELNRSRQFSCIMSCILFDVDDFKQINDTYGHLAGDEALKFIANTVNESIREVDIFGRYGGEEFLILLPNTTAEQARQFAERIRKNIATSPFTFQKQSLTITISLGISDSNINSPKSEDELLQYVDTALYEAKNQGKNQSVLFQVPH